MEKIINCNSVQMFNMCAYFAPDKIPVDIFIRGNRKLPEPLSNNITIDLQRNEIIRDLIRYSLLIPERDDSSSYDEKRVLYMHRLLQEVVQKSFGKDSTWLTYCLEMVNEAINWRTSTKESINAFKRESFHVIAIVEKSCEIFEEDINKLEIVAQLFHELSTLFGKLHDSDSGITYCDKCIEIMEKCYVWCNSAMYSFNLFMAYINRANFYTLRSAYNKAIENYDMCINIGDQMLVNGNMVVESELAKTYMNRGVANEYIKNHEKALLDKNKSIEIYERLYNKSILDDVSDLALAYMNRGVTYKSLNRYHESFTDYNTSIEIWERLRKEGKVIDEGCLALTYLSRERVNLFHEPQALDRLEAIHKNKHSSSGFKKKGWY